MVEVSYISASGDSSGYAEAARNHIAALHISGVTVHVKPISFENYKTDLSKLGSMVQTLINKTADTKIQILHTTPQTYPQMIRNDKYNIGYAAWETDKLPYHWVDYVNKLNELWVPSTHNVEVMKSSGVTIPVFCFPHPFNHKYHEELQTQSVYKKDPDEFVFYSIFQWLERKNPAGLLKAYLTEFKHNEKVCLVLKTFLSNPQNHNESMAIKDHIKNIKAKLQLGKYPKILLISSLLSKEEVLSLHQICDCYVSLNRCEGFGIPLVEAMLASKPVIATSYGGASDFLKGGLGVNPRDVTGYPVGYQMTPVYSMPWKLYTGDMNWAEPNLVEAKAHMRDVFTRQKLAKKIGQQGCEFIKENFSWDKIGYLMKSRLEQIESDING